MYVLARRVTTFGDLEPLQRVPVTGLAFVRPSCSVAFFFHSLSFRQSFLPLPSEIKKAKPSMSDGDAAATPFIAASSAHSPVPRYRRINSLDNARDHRFRNMGTRKKGGWVLVASYVSDWIILIIVAVVGFILGNITPNKRPFYLEDPNIS